MYQPKIQTDAVAFRLASQVDQRTKLVITDVDGTLASFWDYFVPAVRDFLRDVSIRLDIPVAQLAEDIGRVVERRGTHEYPWLLEETGFAWAHFADKPDEFVRDFVKPFWAAMDENRSKYLRPYPQVVETLQELKRLGIKVVALSDAPDYMARIRNKQVFDGLLDAVYALETVEPDKKDVWQPLTLEYGRQRLADLKKSTANLKTQLHVIPKDYEKPCPHGLDLVLRDFGVFPYETIFVGDSLRKDGLVAASRGIRFVWAHYGHQLPAEYEELVHQALKPVTPAPIETQIEAAPFVEAIAARYDELLNHI
ncbi:MAG: HAD family hydrolase [Candidatus Melainabacteria bacterium]|nr:HAD family hydrolase [Candidatus Melainabacteria bacterium]